MSGAVADAARLVLFPIGAAAIGAVVAAVRRLSDHTTGLVQHFAGGVVFAAVAGEVLPSLRDQHSLRAVLIGFTIGVATVVALGAYERRAEKSDAGRTGLPKAMLAAIVIDLLIDGLLVGMGAALGEGQGRTLTIALTLEVLFLGLSLTAELVDRSLKTAVAIGVPIAASLAIAVGAVGGASVLGGASHATLAAVLAFGAAALLYLVTEELLVEAHETPDTNWHVIAFFAGFIILFALEG